MANKILIARGTKARIETIKGTLETYEVVYATDTGELGVKKADGNIEYFMNTADIWVSLDEVENSVYSMVSQLDDRVEDYNEELHTIKQDKLVAGDNISIDENNVISASGKDFHRVRIFNEQDELVATQILYDGEKVLPLDKQGNLFDFGTRNLFDYDTVITEDIDLTYSIIPPRYVETTTADFNASGNYIGTEEYIILPKDKTSGYRILNLNVKGVATNGDYLTNTSGMFNGNTSLYLELDYLNTSSVTTMFQMFYNSQAITLDLSSFDTSNVTNMNTMFRNSKATLINLSSFDTSNVTAMRYMFQDSQATTLDVRNLDTSKVTNMSLMFYGSQAITLDLSSFDTSNVTDMSQMFEGSQATTLDVRNFDTSKVTAMSSMFSSSQATTLDLSSFDTSNAAYMASMFNNSQATTGYARTQADANKFNNSSNKPAALTFVVK